jgi:hypothetical protein
VNDYLAFYSKPQPRRGAALAVSLFFDKEEDFPHGEISKCTFEHEFFFFWKTKLMPRKAW